MTVVFIIICECKEKAFFILQVDLVVFEEHDVSCHDDPYAEKTCSIQSSSGLWFLPSKNTLRLKQLYNFFTCTLTVTQLYAQYIEHGLAIA